MAMKRKPGAPDPAALAQELAAIHEQLIAISRQTGALSHEYVWLDAATLTTTDDALDVDTALHNAREKLDHLAHTLRIATDGASVAHAHLTRLHTRNQQ